jgi:methyl-accepting chemotaxis protein
MLKQVLTKIRGSFVLKYTLVVLGLVLVLNAVQIAASWIMFAKHLNDSGAIATDVAVVLAINLGLLVVLLLVFGQVGKRFLRPLGEVVASVRAACEGELGHKAHVTSPDEFGVLAHSYNQLTDLMSYLVTQTHESSARLAQASSEILSATEQQASGAAEQAASISETTATMEELATTYRQIAENASQVVQMADASLGSAESGQQAVLTTLEAMEEIKARAQTSANKILELGERSQ